MFFGDGTLLKQLPIVRAYLFCWCKSASPISGVCRSALERATTAFNQGKFAEAEKQVDAAENIDEKARDSKPAWSDFHQTKAIRRGRSTV